MVPSVNNTITTPSPLLGTITFIVARRDRPLLDHPEYTDNGYAAWVGALAITIASAARFTASVADNDTSSR